MIPRQSQNTAPQPQLGATTLGPDAAILDGHPAPIFVIDTAGAIVGHNAPAAALLAVLRSVIGAVDAIGNLGRTAIQQAQATTMRFGLGDGDDRQAYEAMAVPTTHRRALLMCRDCTLDENIRLALTESRRRYQDLVNIDSDFAWETSSEGLLTFVSPAGALGLTAAELIGLDPSTLLAEPERLPETLPFRARRPVRDERLWFRTADGRAICMVISAAPVLAPDGGWQGARGICRDITEQISRDGQLRAALVREQLTAYLVDQIRTEADPSAMLEAAATALAGAVSATVLVYSVVADGAVQLMAQAGPADAAALVDVLLAQFVAGPTDVTQRTVVDRTGATLGLLAGRTGYRSRTNGLIVLLRNAADKPWNGDDNALLDAAARQLGIALEQVTDAAALERLSRTDELTGLLNRRAFAAALKIGLRRADRERRSGALLYIDLDNFKPVNDRFGHARGDAVLRAVAVILADHARSYDLVARLGGDEFVMWLDGAGSVQACQRRDRLVDAFALAGADILPPDCQIGASIGIVNLPVVAETSVDELLTRADRAMYHTKAARQAERHAGPHASALDTDGPQG